MSKKHKKPTGEIENVFQFSDSVNSKIKKFQFPTIKEHIEEKIARLFLKLIESSDISELKGLSLLRNQEYDLDFCLVVGDSKKYFLELTEFTPPGSMKGGYQKLSYSHNVGEHAQKIIDLIQKKSNKYSAIKSDIILLAYISDQRSLPSISTEKIIKHYLNINITSFKYVYLILPIMENDGALIRLFPNEVMPLSEETISKLKNSTVHNLNMD